MNMQLAIFCTVGPICIPKNAALIFLRDRSLHGDGR